MSKEKIKEVSWASTLWLSFFLGFFGVDRFFMGKTKTGILKLITVGGFGFWYLIDLILIMKSYKFENIKWKFPENKTIHIVAICLLLVLAIFSGSEPTQNTITQQEIIPIEVTIDELYSSFGAYSDLSDIQKENLYETKYEGKTIKTSIRADRISDATLSSQYVVLQNSGRTSCIAKAFFPSTEKDKLLKANIGSTIVFTGKLINYDFGFASCLEFSKSKVVEIK
ncbi:MAG: TM2 domain-containing protein [Candidatus Aenigmarchaeota archaeon]|nr:TM2 domain-containing protein [Candidatus Aenigmarchaeota archaeon]